MEASRPAPVRSDALVAIAIATALSSIWALHGWTDLMALRLPDADDMMRLQQIRDWLGGQSFADLTQYRLGSSGVPMHWSRLDDLVPGGIIWSLQTLIGRHASEVVAVIAWPAMLLAAAILLIGRIARHAGGPEIAGPAMIIAAIAYPATTLFVPGRIDHHGLQLVLLLAAVLALLKKPSASTGAVAGIATVLSLVVGMEMMPLFAAAGGILIVDWMIGAERARTRLAGYGGALILGTLVASAVFRTIAWDYPACDGFTRISARALLFGSFAPLGLACLPPMEKLELRAGAALLLALLVAAAVAISAPACLSPYGDVAPALRQLWLSRVTEAQPLLAAPASRAVANAGLMFAGLAASAWCAWRTGERGWVVLLLLQLSAAAVTMEQLRGASAGALLAAPALAAVVLRARPAGALATIGAWTVSAGVVYPFASAAIAQPSTSKSTSSCTAPDLVQTLGRLPVGVVMAPVDTAAPAISATRQQLIAGAYHRDGAGDLAMYSFFMGSGPNAHSIAERWRVRWVVACDGFGGVQAPFASSLERGEAPSWLRPAARVGSGARIFEVTD